MKWQLKLQEVKAVPTFGLHADTFLPKTILTANSYSSCRIVFFCDSSRNQFYECDNIKAWSWNSCFWFKSKVSSQLL